MCLRVCARTRVCVRVRECVRVMCVQGELCLVGEALLEQALNEVDDLWHVLGHTADRCRQLHAERLHVLHKLALQQALGASTHARTHAHTHVHGAHNCALFA